MSEVLEEVKNAIELLKLNSDVRLLEDDGGLYLELLDRFVEGEDCRWWWSSLKLKASTASFDTETPFEELSRIVPDSKEKVWFMVEDNELPYFPIFESSTENAIKIIGECFAFEYYLISKSKEWLICESHHDTFYGVGKIVTDKLDKYAM